MPLYTFTCAEHGSWDSREPYGTDVINCVCGRASSRESVYRINFGGYASTPGDKVDFYQDYRRFREASEGLDDQVTAVEKTEGVKYNSPLFQHAKQKAAELLSKGVTADDI